MTKMRPPLSIERALVRIADTLGWEGMAAITGRATRTMMDWSDADTSAGPTLRDAIALDLAFLAAGGDGAPLHDCYAIQLDQARRVAFADEGARARAAQTLLKESTEGVLALIDAAQPGVPLPRLREALTELQQADEAVAAAIGLVNAAIERRLQPPPGDTS